jgi:transposase
MNDATFAELVQNQFATAVRDFTPKSSSKFQTLLPFKDGIAELRRKGASYETIADILRNTNVVVSHDTVTRFCHEVLGLTPAQRRRRKRSSRRATQKPHSRPQTLNAPNHTAQGPRVADPNNI